MRLLFFVQLFERYIMYNRIIKHAVASIITLWVGNELHNWAKK